MYTFVSLQRIIDTLPVYEKNKLKIEGVENVNVCLEDIWNVLLDYEKKDFIENNSEAIARECCDQVCFTNYVLDESSDWDKLSSIDDDTIVSYLQDQGYNITDY
jgi:hypothetical protein